MGHKVLVTNQPEAEAMEYAKRLGVNSITYGALPHLFGDIPLPFVYDESEVDFSRSDNPVHRYKIVTKMVKQQIPMLEPVKVFDERTGKWNTMQRQKVKPKLQFRFRLETPELGEESKIKRYSVLVDEPIFEEKEIPIDEVVES